MSILNDFGYNIQVIKSLKKIKDSISTYISSEISKLREKDSKQDVKIIQNEKDIGNLGLEVQRIDNKKQKVPIKGQDYFTQKELDEIKQEITPKHSIDYFTSEESRKFRKDITPQKGRDYFTKLELAEIKKEVTPKKNVDYYDGKDGAPGMRGETRTFIEEKELSPDEIKEKIVQIKDTRWFDSKFIKNLPKPQVVRGGGRTVMTQIQKGDPKETWYVFDNVAERDTFFIANPDLLVEDILICIKDTTPPPTPGVRSLDFSETYNSQYKLILSI